MISSSQVASRAIQANVPVVEIVWCGNVMGFQIGNTIVRHDSTGWYDEAKVDAAVAAHKMRRAA